MIHTTLISVFCDHESCFTMGETPAMCEHSQSKPQVSDPIVSIGKLDNLEQIGEMFKMTISRKPALWKDTGYMVEKTYTDIPPYLGAFGA